MRGKWFHNNSLRFLKYGLVLIAGLFLVAGVFLINEQNWVALSALTTLILALAAFWAIWQNYSLHKRERKERLLNEIIEWAMDVAVCAFSVPAPMMLEDITGGLEEAAIEKMVRRANLTHYTNLRLSYQILTRKSKYIENIASSLPGNLDYAVKRLRKQIDNVISGLKKCARDPSNKDRSEYENLIRAEDSLHKKADILIKEAVKIKTRDIG